MIIKLLGKYYESDQSTIKCRYCDLKINYGGELRCMSILTGLNYLPCRVYNGVFKYLDTPLYNILKINIYGNKITVTETE